MEAAAQLLRFVTVTPVQMFNMAGSSLSFFLSSVQNASQYLEYSSLSCLKIFVWLREEEYYDWLFYAVPMSSTTKEKQKLKFLLYIDIERSRDS